MEDQEKDDKTVGETTDDEEKKETKPEPNESKLMAFLEKEKSKSAKNKPEIILKESEATSETEDDTVKSVDEAEESEALSLHSDLESEAFLTMEESELSLAEDSGNETDLKEVKYHSDTQTNTQKNRMIIPEEKKSVRFVRRNSFSLPPNSSANLHEDREDQYMENRFNTRTDALSLTQAEHHLEMLPKAPHNVIAPHQELTAAHIHLDAPDYAIHNDIYHVDTKALKKAKHNFSVHHNPYKKYRRINDYEPLIFFRSFDHFEKSCGSEQILGEIDEQEVMQNLGVVNRSPLQFTYDSIESVDEDEESGSDLFYDSGETGSEDEEDSFEALLKTMHLKKLKKSNESAIKTSLLPKPYRNEKEVRISRPISEVVKKTEEKPNEESPIVVKKEKPEKKKKEKSKKEDKQMVEEKAESEKIEKKDSKLELVKKEKPVLIKKLSLEEGQTSSPILDLDEKEDEESGSSKKKDRKKKKDKAKKKKDKPKNKKKEKAKKKKQVSGILSLSGDEVPKEEKKDSSGDGKAAENNTSVERRKQRLEDLKKLAEEEEAAEEGAEEEGGGEPGSDAGDVKEAEPAEEEGPEPQFGIQYDPERQICLGDPIKVGTSVWAVDFLNDKKFRKGKIVAFVEPASYTVKFGLFRRQPGTQRLDILIRQPKAKGGFRFRPNLFKSSKDIFAAASSGDTQTVLDLILKNADLVDKVGGKEKQKPLYYAAKNGHVEVVRLLLRYGAEDDEEGTVLAEADASVRRVLVEFGWGKVGRVGPAGQKAPTSDDV